MKQAPPSSSSSSGASPSQEGRSGSSAVAGAAGNGPQASSSSTPKDDGQLGPFVLIGGAFVLPHPEKMHRGGEDWFFVSDTMRAIGVADGVGGWAEVGVDAGAYARQLMAKAKEYADSLVSSGNEQFLAQCKLGSELSSSGSSGGGGGSSRNGAAEADAFVDASGAPALQQIILEKAAADTKVRGSSTASVVVLAGQKLFASNLGDSGFMIIRNEEVCFHSPSQQHGFNFPFQIGSADSMSDPPTSAQRFAVPIEAGDVIVMGTDGLWDNCFDEEITAVIKYCMSQEGAMSMDKVAQVLAFYARHRASDPKYASPFAYSAFQADLAYMGGKMDDITCVVARVAPAKEVEGAPVPGQGGIDQTLPASKM